MEDREISEKDILKLGYNREMATRIVKLLGEEALLESYLRQGQRQGCRAVSRVSEEYPFVLRQRLGLDSPGCLWTRGDLSILNTPAIALVGSRELREPNRDFAAAVGRHAALRGLTLVSGNARGADRTAQEACLQSGGRVISFVADELCRQPLRKNMLYVSEDGFAEGFSAQRALSRNRCIHGMGQIVFVAQSELGRGGSWDGTVKNLRFGWSPVFCFQDGSESAAQLEQMGAYLISIEELEDFSIPQNTEMTFF